MQRWTIALVLACSLAVAASAERYWEGSAAQYPGDATFSAGAFAASNSFASGTDVVVLDPATGASTVVRVVQRIDGRSDMLILLSPPAAQALGIEPGESIDVRVTIKPPAASTGLAADTGQRVDPELGAAAATAPGEATPPTVEPAPAPQVAEAAPPEEAAAEPAATGPGPSAEDEAMLGELANRSPQKMLSLPPREDQLFAYKEPSESPAEVAEAAPAAAEPAPTEPAREPPAEAAPSSQQVPKVESLPAVAPSAATQIAAGSLPTPEVAPVAPAVPPAAEPAAPVQVAAAALPVRAAPVQPPKPSAAQGPATVKPGAYYVQLAAYSDEVQARATAATLAKTWPAAILEPEAGAARLFRLVIGPLNRAESGTLLFRFQHAGYPDAFVRAP